jgi:hypothetical protein
LFFFLGEFVAIWEVFSDVIKSFLNDQERGWKIGYGSKASLTWKQAEGQVQTSLAPVQRWPILVIFFFLNLGNWPG